MEPLLRTTTENSWVFAIILSTLVLMAAARFLFSKQFSSLGNLTLFLEHQEGVTALSVLTNILLSVLIGLLLFPFVQLPFESGEWSAFLNAVTVIGLVLLYFTIRYLFNLILMLTMGYGEELNHVMKVKVYFRTFAIFILILLNLLLYYSDFQNHIIFFTGIGVIVILLVLEYLFQIRNKAGIGIYLSYYFILYLCILEILPVLFVIKHWNG